MSIAVLGASGFVGSAIVRALSAKAIPFVAVNRSDEVPDADVLINAACPSQRLRAEREPEWDFEECVAKTARFYYRRKGRFLQVSSVSARFPNNSAYGRHRKAAEDIVSDALVVRLGPMYGDTLAKGILFDIIHDRPVYADPETYYAFADVDWCAQRIVSLAIAGRTRGVVEVGGSGAIRIGDIPARVGSKAEFLPSEFLPREDQDFISSDGPRPEQAVEWARLKRTALLKG
jgi:nucleoside-diphosphate-sugar epimerase